MNVTLSNAPRATAPTQLPPWNWVDDWAELDGRLRELERRHCWNWRRDLAELEDDLQELSPA